MVVSLSGAKDAVKVSKVRPICWQPSDLVREMMMA